LTDLARALYAALMNDRILTAPTAAAFPVVSSTRAPGRLLYLDGLRGVASAGIAILFHYVHFSALYQPGSQLMSDAPLYGVPIFHEIYEHGAIAVDVFFMISGFIFAQIYADEIAAGRISPTKYFVRRFARLYPIQLLTLLVTAVLVYLFFFRTGRFPIYPYNGALEFVLNLLFLQHGTLERGFSFNGPAWSLSVEAAAYAVFFTIAVHGLRLRWAWLAIAVGLVLILSGVSHGWRPMLQTANLGRGLVGFFLGLLIQRLGGRYPVRAVASVLGIGTLPLLLAPNDPNAPSAWVWIVFGLGLLALQRWPSLRRPFEVRALVVLGDLSLAVYMIHFPVQVGILLALNWVEMPIPFASAVFLAAYAGIVLGLAAVVHYRFELPMQRVLRRRLGG
jgi:peptidoglycan/LPS O-acetylase OafA/YrhL